MTDHDVDIAVLNTRFDQLRADHAQLATLIKDLSRTVIQLEKAVAAQSPMTAMFERLLMVALSAGATWLISRGHP